MLPKYRDSAHPGKIIAGEFLRNNGARELSERTGMSLEEAEQLLRYKLDVDERLARMLADGFCTSPGFWLNLQRNFDEGRKGR